jgi:predicted metalloprotease
MQWFGRRESSNTEDGSASGGRGLALGGGVVGIIAAAIYFFTGIDPSAVLNQVQGGGAPQENNQAAIADTKEKKFAKVVLADTEDVWTKLFNDMGKTYEPPTITFNAFGTTSILISVPAPCGSPSK